MSRRSPALAVLLCAVGGALVLLASGRQWAHAAVIAVAGAGRTTVSVTGHQAATSLPATGIALLALAVAILAASGPMRRLVGAVVVLIGIAAVGAAIAGQGNVDNALQDQETGTRGLAVHASANGWWVVALVGGLLALSAGVLTVVRSPAWSRMSAKYDAPSTPKPVADPAGHAWDALDRGEDPTV
jgi:uncharacterized membrane protein (TIGR02234 family)